MKILESQSAILCNAEVLAHLTTLSSRRTSNCSTKAALKSPNFETINKEVLTEYLRPAPSQRSPLPDYGPKVYADSTIRTLITKLKKYDLTKAELLMVLNLKPGDMGFLDAVVEECDERFGEQEQEEILRVVGEVLGGESGLGGGDNREGGESAPEPMEVDGEGEVDRERGMSLRGG